MQQLVFPSSFLNLLVEGMFYCFFLWELVRFGDSDSSEMKTDFSTCSAHMLNELNDEFHGKVQAPRIPEVRVSSVYCREEEFRDICLWLLFMVEIN